MIALLSLAHGADVLVLGDGVADTIVDGWLTTAGHTTTVAAYDTWDGADITDYDTVVWLEGAQPGLTLTPEGDDALFLHVIGGGGLLRTHRGAVNVYDGIRFAGNDDIDTLMPVTSLGQETTAPASFTWFAIDGSHPLVLGGSFGGVFTSGAVDLVLEADAAAPVEDSNSRPAVAYGSYPGGVVYINSDIADNNSTIQTVVLNAIGFLATPDMDGDLYPEHEDCDDDDGTVYLGAPELCDGVDNDCNGFVDDGGGDFDNDGYGLCEDCNDNDFWVNPGVAEECDNVDNNCDGNIDEGHDVDEDGWRTCDGDCVDTDDTVFPGASDANCDGKDNDCNFSVDDANVDADFDGYNACVDCNDASATVYPGAPEVCDGLDNDCDGSADPVVDADGDGVNQCDGDCDDLNNQVNPNQAEICGDGLDNDCDGFADSADADNDGVNLCTGDCDDNNQFVFPGGNDIPNNGIDENCDGIDGSGTGTDTANPEDEEKKGLCGLCSVVGAMPPAGAVFLVVLALRRREESS